MEKFGRIARRAGPIVLQVAGLAWYVAALLGNTARIHEPRTFGDSGEYLDLAAKPLLSAEFWTGIKPPLTSLFYKLVGADPAGIWTLQLWVSIICWAVLAFAVASAIRSTLLKPVAFGVILAFSLSRDVFMWAPFIGSESITISMTALFVAAAVWLAADWKAYKIPPLIGAALLMALARDASAYLLPMIAVAMLPLLLISRRRRDLLILMASFILIFGVSASLARASQRPYRNFLSLTAFRIFPNPEYLAYFRDLGMPIDAALVEESQYSLTPGHEKYAVLGALMGDPEQQAYRDWVEDHGTQAYLKFLWFFKADTLQGMFMQDAQHVFFPDVYYYTATGYRPIIRSQRLSELLYPSRFGLLFFFVANIAAALACGFALQHRKGHWFVPILLIFLTYPQAFISWNGDANEIPRHSVEHNVTERLGMWILVLFVLDFALQAAIPYLPRAWSWGRARYDSVFGRKRAQPLTE